MENIRHILCDTISLKDHHFDTFIKLAKKKLLNKKESIITAGTVCNFIGIVTNWGTKQLGLLKINGK